VLSVKELEDRLQIAVDNEKYEVAAKIRDQINDLKE
jgi:protein-arginine kinase activator protein McsA